MPLLALLAPAWLSSAAAAPAQPALSLTDLLPSEQQRAYELQSAWLPDTEGALRSDIVAFPEGGTRVGVLLEAPAEAALFLEARGVDEAGLAGPWLPLDELWRGGDAQRVLRVDLEGEVSAAQLRVWGTDQLDHDDLLSWELLSPVHEARRLPAGPPSPAPEVSDALEDIGVVSREDWGASSTECSTTEDDWYRFAIHHTAGGQTSGGTVQGAVQSLQAYSMGSGGYCDIPYQFVVGFDGSLWEGRNLRYYSGATGAGNNNGNIAISFLGCYDSDGCGSIEVDETLDMLAGARLLAQTLAEQEDTETTSELLLGHRDHDGASTACPGDKVHARLDEIRSATAHYEGQLVDSAWTDETVFVELGEVATGWVELENTGMETWTDNTRLAPLPRDEASPMAADSWLASDRVSVPETDADQGELAVFPVEITGHELGTHSLELTLVEESVTWFPDAPIGGGPLEGELVLTVEVVEPGTLPEDDTGGGGSGGGSGGGGTGTADGTTGTGQQELGTRIAPADGKGCGCTSTPSRGTAPLVFALFGLLLGRRGRRGSSTR